MRLTRRILPRRLLTTALALLGTTLAGFCQGIPEPSLIMYGLVRNTNSGANVRWNFGTLNWTIQPTAGGSPIVVSTTLTNINDQFCYLIQVPCENTIGGFTVSSNTIPLSSVPATFDRSQVMINGNVPATFVNPAQTNVSLSVADRGRIEEVDLTVSIPLVDTDGNGLPDAWEMFYFGRIGNDPQSRGANGMTLFESYKAGNNPNDTNSVFRVINVTRGQSNTVVTWSSEPGVFYGIQRSTSAFSPLIPLSGFSDIATNIPATSPTNTYVDNTATNSTKYFYRVRLDQVYISPVDLDGNGLPDDWERLYFGTTGVDPNADPDHDGYTNMQEYLAGTSPIDPNSHPH